VHHALKLPANVAGSFNFLSMPPARTIPVLLLLHFINFGSALGWKVASQLLLLLFPGHTHTLKLQGPLR
jgi:hypothetical protein